MIGESETERTQYQIHSEDKKDISRLRRKRICIAGALLVSHLITYSLGYYTKNIMMDDGSNL